jgi:hypothetical protein
MIEAMLPGRAACYQPFVSCARRGEPAQSVYVRLCVGARAKVAVGDPVLPCGLYVDGTYNKATLRKEFGALEPAVLGFCHASSQGLMICNGAAM